MKNQIIEVNENQTASQIEEKLISLGYARNMEEDMDLPFDVEHICTYGVTKTYTKYRHLACNSRELVSISEIE